MGHVFQEVRGMRNELNSITSYICGFFYGFLKTNELYGKRPWTD